MGSGGKGASSAGSTTYEEPEISKTMAKLSEQLFQEATPGRRELFGQGLEALKTGGVSAQIPSVQRAVESSKMALGDAIKSIDTNMGTAGLGGTPYAERTKAETTMKGELANNQAALQIGQWFMQMLPNLVSGTQTQGLQAGQTATQGANAALGATASSSNAAMASNTAKGGQMMDAMMTPFRMFSFSKQL